jgi:hypothetical protein
VAVALVPILSRLTEHKTLYQVVQVVAAAQPLLAVVRAVRLHLQAKEMPVVAVILMEQHIAQAAVVVEQVAQVQTFLLQVVAQVVLVDLVRLHIHLGQVLQVAVFQVDTLVAAVLVVELVVLQLTAAVQVRVLAK